MLIHSRILLTGMALSLASSVALAAPGYDVVSGPLDEKGLFDDGNFQFSTLIGIATVDQNDGTIAVTRSETDTLLQTNGDAWDSWTGMFGVGYVFPLEWEDEEEYSYHRHAEEPNDNEPRWFGTVTPQLNLYILSGTTLEGDVRRFNDLDDVDATYDMEFDSTRLMFDVALDVLTVSELSFYVIAGLGVAWNSANFDLTPNDCVPIHGLNIQESQSTDFAYEFGAGLDYALYEEFDITLQYLYTGLTDVGVGGVDDIFHVHSSDMDVVSQAVFLGIRFGV